MQSLKYLPASNQAANPSLASVTTLRSPGAADILVNTVAGFPAFFYATMGTPHTFTDPVTGETITVISEASAVDFAGHLNSGKITIDAIAPGYADTAGSKVGDIVIVRPITAWADNLFNILSQSLNDDGTVKNGAITADAMFATGLAPSTRLKESLPDYVVSGGALASVSGLTGSMSDIIYYIGGNRYTITGIANKLYTASKDTYVDVNTSQAVVYTEVANGAAAPALAANHKRIGKLISGASLGIIQQVGYDSLGNRYHNTVTADMNFLKNWQILSASADTSVSTVFKKPRDIMTLGSSQKVRWQPYPRTGGSGAVNLYRIAYYMKPGAAYNSLEPNSGTSQTGETSNYQSISFAADEAGTQYYATYELSAQIAEGFLRVELHRDGASGSDTNPNGTELEGCTMMYLRDYTKTV